MNIVHGAKNRSLRKLDLSPERKQETVGSRSLTMVVVILVALVREGRRDELGGWGRRARGLCSSTPNVHRIPPALRRSSPFAHV